MNDYPHYKSVYHYYNSWSKKGIGEQIHLQLVSKVRVKAGRPPGSIAGYVDYTIGENDTN